MHILSHVFPFSRKKMVQRTTKPTIRSMTRNDSHQRVHPHSMVRVPVHHFFSDNTEAVQGTSNQEDWSDCADPQAALRLRWSHKSYNRFCCALAEIYVKIPRNCHNHKAQLSRGTNGRIDVKTNKVNTNAHMKPRTHKQIRNNCNRGTVLGWSVRKLLEGVENQFN